jgi:uncharacterized protein (DUF2141 family)
VRHRPRARLTGALALTLAGGALIAADAGGSVSVTVTGLRSPRGQVLVCLTRQASSFPDCTRDASAFKAAIPAGRPATVRFAGVPAGSYAIAVLHDENGNGKADRMLGMIPTEGFGFSRDAPVRMGPPKFADAAFRVGADETVQILRMRYMM